MPATKRGKKGSKKSPPTRGDGRAVEGERPLKVLENHYANTETKQKNLKRIILSRGGSV